MQEISSFAVSVKFTMKTNEINSTIKFSYSLISDWKETSIPSTSATMLSLTVKEQHGHGRSEVIKCHKISSVKVWTPSRYMHSLLNFLMEQHKHNTMNPGRRLWALVAYYFVSWNFQWRNCFWEFVKHSCMHQLGSKKFQKTSMIKQFLPNIH